MSLNGLDDPKIKEAHDTAAAEPGGWFLLKYVSRDEVELLGRGNGGIVEIRNAIAQYEEPAAALFGFLRYRRRNVVIKYVPEECSRLVQARVTVHFNAVTERFSPHDTVFPIASSKELRDTTLSAACSLHTASGSTSSSTSSLRRRRLMEIAEDEEEDQRAKRQSTVPEERPPTAKTSSVSGGQSSLSPSSPTPELLNGLPASTSYQSMVVETASPAKTDLQPSDFNSPIRSTTEPQRRKSSQSTRPDIYSYASYGSNGKPKIKLGPRPSLDVGGRPHTSSVAFYRPVSTLPAGLKLFSRSSFQKDKGRPQSTYNSEPPSMTISPPPIPDSLLSPVSTGPVRPHTSGGRTPASSAASKPLASPTIIAPKTPSITPEKARLMKAMELRKKKQAAPPSPGLPPPIASVASPETPDNRLSSTPKEFQNSPAELDDMAKGEDSSFDASSTLKTDESDANRSDSYPVSPVGPSEQAESTRASSISESTDETIHEPNNLKPTPANNGSDDKEPQSNINQESDESTMIENDYSGLVAAEAILIEEPQVQPEEHHSVPSHADVSKTEEEAPAVIQDPEPFAETVELEPAAQEAEELATPKIPSASAVVDANELATDIPAEQSTSSEVQLKEIESKIEVNDTDQQTIPETADENSDEQSQAKPEVIVQPASPVRQWKIPRSKFSVQDLKTEASAPDLPDEPVPALPSTVAPKSPVASTSSTENMTPATEEDEENGQSMKKKKRRGLVEPIRTDLKITDRSAANSEANFSSDDELMDELQSAVFQEAKPMSVSKSPISPVFPSPQKRNGEPGRFSRVFSSPFKKEGSDPNLLGTPTQSQPVAKRSVSAAAAYLDKINQQSTKPLASKVNLGSGISQRIKALEKLGAGTNTTPSTTGPTPGVSTGFFSVRNGSARPASRSPSIAERANSLTQDTSPLGSRESSPETLKFRERAESIKNKMDAFKSNPIPPMQIPSRSRPESISVTARIIRDPAQPFPAMSEAGKNPADYAPLDLKQSPLVIDHQKAVTETPKETIQERRLSKERRLSAASRTTTTTTKERRSSITIVREFINDTRTSISERRRSINLDRDISSPSMKSPSIKSPSRPPSVHQSRPMSILSSRLSISNKELSRDGGLSPPPTASSSSSISDEKGEKRSGRASRMLRRMSSSLSSGRKSLAHAVSPTVREDPEPRDTLSPSSSNSQTPMRTSLNVGDVNVQFPDGLLWKRRSMLLDSQGYLILSPALATSGNSHDKSSTGATRRYHLSEFRTPLIPDIDMQESANSVVLDFIEGGGLQIGCEDRAGQGHVFKVLLDAHRSWAAFGP